MVARRREYTTEYVAGMDESGFIGSVSYVAKQLKKIEPDPHRPNPDGIPRLRHKAYVPSTDVESRLRDLDNTRDRWYRVSSGGETVTGKQMSAGAVNFAELATGIDQVFAFRDGLFAKEIASRLGINIGPRRLRNIFVQAAVKGLRPRDVARTNGTTTYKVQEIVREVTELLVDILFD